MNQFNLFERDFKQRLVAIIKYYNPKMTDEDLKVKILEIMYQIEGKNAVP